MKTNFFFIALITFLNLVSNQFSSQVNLVNNPSFEDLTNNGLCPDALNQLSRCAGWVPTYASPDYYNSCSTNNISRVPQNVNGYQTASDGQAYAGFIALNTGTFNPYYREYLGTNLIQPLVPGTRYYLSMKVNTAEHWQDVNEGWEWKSVAKTAHTNTMLPTYLPCNKLGMKFYTKAHIFSYPSYIGAMVNNFAHLYTQNIINDTISWTTVQGSFIADSAYTHLIIGNFFTNVNTDTIARANALDSYYFVDDIIVSTDSNILTGLNKNSTQSNIAKLYPNPVTDKLNLEFNSGTDDLKFVITNTLGQMVLNSKIKMQNYKADIDLAFLQSGIYYLKIEGDKETGIFKIIKQ